MTKYFIIGSLLLTSWAVLTKAATQTHKDFSKYFLFNPDTTILNAKLVDTLNDSVIWAMPDHIGLSARFQFSTTFNDKQEIDILIFAPEIYGKGFFKINEHYNLFASNRNSKYVFRPLSHFANPNGPFLIRDSIKVVK